MSWQLFVQLYTSRILLIDVTPQDTVGGLKKIIVQKFKLACSDLSQLRLFNQGKLLQLDESSLIDCSLGPESNIIVMFK